MATKTKALPKKPATVVEQISELVDKHIDTVEAIIETYSWLSDVGMDTELRAANEKLGDAIADFEYSTTDAEKFQQLIVELNLIHKIDFDADKILELLSDKEIEGEALLKLIDPEQVNDYFIEQGYAAVKLNNMLDRDKLETFLKTEIYPNYTDQESFLII